MICVNDKFRTGIEWLVRLTGIMLFLFFAFREREQVNDAALVTMAVLVISLFVNRNGIPPLSMMDNLAGGVLAGILTLQLSITEFWQSPCILWIGAIPKLIMGAVIYANLFLAMRLIWEKARDAYSGSVLPGRNLLQKGSGRGLATCKWVIAGESILYLGGAYPGLLLLGDTSDVFTGVITNEWNSWHTLGYMLFVKLCTLIHESMFTVNVVQTILWILLNFYILDLLGREEPRHAYLYTILVSLAALPFLYLGIMYKDTVYSMGVLGLTAVLYKVMTTQEMTVRDGVYLGIFPLFALLCRHGGLVPVVISTSAAGIWFWRKKRRELTKMLLGAAVWFLVAWMVVNIILAKVLSATENPSYIKYSVPMSMVGAAVADGIEFSPEDTQLLEEIMPLERWAECYNKYWADDLDRPHGKIGEEAIVRLEEALEEKGFGKELIRLNAQLLITHPMTYLRAFFDMNSIMWELAKPHDAQTMALSRVEEDFWVRYSAAYSLTHPLNEFMDEYPLAAALVTRGGAALFVLLFCAAVMVSKNRLLAIPFLPIGIVSLMLSITIPAQDPRYILPAMECGIFFLSPLMSRMIQKKGEYENGKNSSADPLL